MDATTAYEDGTTTLEGRDAIVAWLPEASGSWCSDRYRNTDEGWRSAHTGYRSVLGEHR